MEKFKIIFKLSIKFLQRYLPQYLYLMLNPFLIALIGFSFLFLVKINPLFGIFALFITIPCIFYSFWKGFLITYSLNCASYNFIKKDAQYDLKACLETVKKDEKKFAVYITKSFLLIVAPFCLLILAMRISTIGLMLIIPVAVIVILYVLFLIPFCSFMTQAYYYKNEDDSFYSIFKSCYKNLDSTAYLIFLFSILINILSGSIKNLFFSIATSLVLSLLIFCMCAFWFYAKKFKHLNEI